MVRQLAALVFPAGLLEMSGGGVGLTVREISGMLMVAGIRSRKQLTLLQCCRKFSAGELIRKVYTSGWQQRVFNNSKPAA